jgi:hypothetical protein
MRVYRLEAPEQRLLLLLPLLYQDQWLSRAKIEFPVITVRV